MSGIAGIIHFDGKPIEPGLIEKITGAMNYRVPDGINHWVKNSAALGQCMLRTTPESLEEKQPLVTEDESLVLVLDGRVDNWEELRHELLGRGAVLRDRSDAELVLRAYEIWGEESLNWIIGEFVFFIWDDRERALFGARDAAGTRHFYYYATNSWFAFSSEIRGLLSLQAVNAQLNESRLMDYFVVQFDRDDEVGTFYKGINRLPAGHAMKIGPRGMRTWRYWRPDTLEPLNFKNISDCSDAFLEQLRTAVKCRLRSIKPIGAMLSGGLDSSSIVGLVSKEFKSELNWPLETYSLAGNKKDKCVDRRYINYILESNYFIENKIIVPDESRVEYKEIISKINELDQPFTIAGGLVDSLICKRAKESDCNVILDGMAGDLLFFGLQRSLYHVVKEKEYSKIFSVLRAYDRHGVNNGIRSAVRFLLHSATPEALLKIYRRSNLQRHRDIFLPNQDGWDLSGVLRREVARPYCSMRYHNRRAFSEQYLQGDCRRAHAGVFMSGAISFPHEVNSQIALSMGVEPRSPFSDRRMIEFSVRMPLEAKIASFWYKKTLRNSMLGVLPDAVCWRDDLGGHPGWRFYNALGQAMERSTQDLWRYPHIRDTLTRWVDPASLLSYWKEYANVPNVTGRFRLLLLSILTAWISGRELK